jgi:hypothetical protein
MSFNWFPGQQFFVISFQFNDFLQRLAAKGPRNKLRFSSPFLFPFLQIVTIAGNYSNEITIFSFFSVKVIIQPQAHYCGQCSHRAHQQIPFFFQKKCSTHSSSSFRNDSMKFEQTSSQWKLAVESRDSSERLLLVRIKLVDIFKQKVVVSGVRANGGRRFWPTSKMTRIVKTLVPSPRFENRGENTRSGHKETV